MHRIFSKLSPEGYMRVRERGFNSFAAMISDHQLRTVTYYEWRQEYTVSSATANINNIFIEDTDRE
ncbi:hypothetical protein OESDEN_01753 [Oesophagostomum dentatum]|uniref:Uncharacterized protein n=1 Tax=Oesophagostomum dentatum TaxID=61180 RepID=A0A0B1TS89_OESDE|nr:hypothetical protein OESDEN_01753 [Oesophagostomum dentatum]